MKPLDFSLKPVFSSATVAYFQYYGIHLENVNHFFSPSFRSSYWKLSKISYFLVKLFCENVPGKFNNNSSDTVFLEFVKKGPLQSKYVSLKFVGAFFMWNKRIKDCSIITKPVLVISGKFRQNH